MAELGVERAREALAPGVPERLTDKGVDVERVATAASALAGCFQAGGKILLFGNGGSAADAQHVAAELVGRFLADRRALPAIALTTDTSALTAIANDFGFERIFARQIEALGRPGDWVVAISTSGGSPNVLAGAEAARDAGLRSIALLGHPGSPLEDLVDIAITVRADSVPQIQEAHLAVEHALCGAVEELLFGEAAEGDPTPTDEASGGSVVGWDELLRLRDTWRSHGRRVIWTNGCFDILHVGHVRSLAAARRLGDVLVVGVNSDESIRELKGARRPLVPAEQRAEVVAALASVDYVVVFDETTPAEALARLRPDVHTKGADYEGRELPERKVVEAYGGRVELLPLVPGVSTSELERRLRESSA